MRFADIAQHYPLHSLPGSGQLIYTDGRHILSTKHGKPLLGLVACNNTSRSVHYATGYTNFGKYGPDILYFFGIVVFVKKQLSPLSDKGITELVLASRSTIDPTFHDAFNEQFHLLLDVQSADARNDLLGYRYVSVTRTLKTGYSEIGDNGIIFTAHTMLDVTPGTFVCFGATFTQNLYPEKQKREYKLNLKYIRYITQLSMPTAVKEKWRLHPDYIDMPDLIEYVSNVETDDHTQTDL